MGEIGEDMLIPWLSLKKVDGAHDHVLDGGDGRHIGLEAARRARQVDHVFGRIDSRKNLRLRSRRRRRWTRRGPPAARREWVKSVKTCGFPGFHLKRSMERMIMSLTAEMAATLASKPRAAPVRSTMSSAGLIRGNATYPSGPASGWPGR